MYTVSILSDGTLARREFRDVLACVDWIWVVLGYEVCPCLARVECANGPGICMHVNGAFVSIARLH